MGGVGPFLCHYHHTLGLPPILGVVLIVGSIIVTRLGRTTEGLGLTGLDGLARIVPVLEGRID